MCGIIFGLNTRNSVNKSLVKRYHAQSHRGKDGFGFLPVHENKVLSVVRKMEEKDILKELKDNLSNFILFHHRLPTSTVNIPSATHPIRVSNKSLTYDYYVVHNGVLMNEAILRKRHEALGFDYTTKIKNVTSHIGIDGVEHVSEEVDTFNDSESLAIDLALYLEGKNTFLESSGSIAFVCIRTEKDGTIVDMYYGRNDGNPLVLEQHGDAFFLKSMGHGTPIEADRLYHAVFTDKNYSMEITSQPLPIGIYYGRKTAYPTHTSDWSSKGYKEVEDRQPTLPHLLSTPEINQRNKEYFDDFTQGDDGIWRYRKNGELESDLPATIQLERLDLIELYEQLYALEDERANLTIEVHTFEAEDMPYNRDYLELLTKEIDALQNKILEIESSGREVRA